MNAGQQHRLLGGMKIYSLDWFLAYRLDYPQAAALLDEQGMDLVIAQNRYLPMADTAVKSQVAAEQLERFQAYDDRRFVAALQTRGLRYFAACNLFFDPLTLARHPDARAVDALGRTAEAVDWYLAICPTHEGYFADKLRQLEDAATYLRPNGVFLGFARFPGFWELWLPDTRRADWPEYCFCSRCIRLFGEARGLSLPAQRPRRAAEWIRSQAYAEFVEWKTDVIASRVRQIRSALQAIHRPIQVMLNTIPFGRRDFDGAGREVFAQDWRKLKDVVDIFEVMGYHQILGRDVSWIGRIAREVKQAVQKPVMVTIQAKPLYLDGMHAGRGRKETLSFEEFAEAVRTVKASGADGLVVFTWSDFLQQALADKNTRYVDVIRRLTRG